MFIIKWNNIDRKFLVNRNGEKLLQALQKRGHVVTHRHTMLDGTIYTTVK